MQAWLSGTAWVAPGSTMPSSGATTCEMPCSGSPRSNSRMPWRALPARVARRNGAPSGLVVSSRPGLLAMRVVLRREGEVGPPHRPLLLLELRQRVRRVQIMHDVAIDIDEVAPVGAPRHQVGLPDLVEQGLGHEADSACTAYPSRRALRALLRMRSQALPSLAGSPMDPSGCVLDARFRGHDGFARLTLPREPAGLLCQPHGEGSLARRRRDLGRGALRARPLYFPAGAPVELHRPGRAGTGILSDLVRARHDRAVAGAWSPRRSATATLAPKARSTGAAAGRGARHLGGVHALGRAVQAARLHGQLRAARPVFIVAVIFRRPLLDGGCSPRSASRRRST